MINNDRKAHWQQVYQQRTPQAVSWYQPVPRLSLELIERAGVALTDAIIDVGGGASRLVDHLLRLGYTNLTVLDLSGAALGHARDRLGEAADQVQWIESDVTTFAPPQRYQVWHDRAVFHFLTQAVDRERYLQTLRAALAPGAQVVMATFAVGGPLQCSGLDVVQYDEDKLMATVGNGFQLLETVSELHQTPWGGEQAFCYFRLGYLG